MAFPKYREFLLLHCANCKHPLPPNGKSISKIKQNSNSIKNSNHTDQNNEISMIEAISYIFGASKNYLDEKLKSIFMKQNYDIEGCTFPEISEFESTLSFCENCGPIFSELYEVAKMLRSVSEKNALLWEVLSERYPFEEHLNIPMKEEVNFLSDYDSSFDESLLLPHVQKELGDSSFVNEMASVKIEIDSNKDSHKTQLSKKSTAGVNEHDSGFRKRRSLRRSTSRTPRTETSQIDEYEHKELSVSIQRLPDEIVRTYSENIDDQDELEETFDNERDPLYISGQSESDSSDLNDEENFTKTKTKRKRYAQGMEAYYTAVECRDESSENAKCRFQCNKCDTTFGTRRNVFSHYVYQHFEGSSVHTEVIKGPPFQCPKCDSKFQAQSSLIFHAAGVHDLTIASFRKMRQDSKVLKCHDCDVSFSSVHGFSIHQFTKHNRKCYSCTTCGDTFRIKSELESHRKAFKHRGIQQRKEIPKNENDQEEIGVPEQLSDDIFFCRDCNYKFSSRYALNIHLVKSHEGRPKYDCKSCDESFITLISFLKHSTDVHREFPKPENYKYQCTCTEPNCGSVVYDVPSLKKHQRSATHSTFEIICAFCEDRFTDTHSMEIHNRAVHNNKRVVAGKPVSKISKVYKCNSCEIIINDNTEMTAHKLIHPDVEMTFKCPVCQKLFPTYNQVQYHKSTHSMASKDFQCETCGKKFKGKMQYRIHCRYHLEKAEGVRPMCDLCGKNFSTLKTLNKHKGIMHFGKQAKICSLCGHTSKTNWHLLLHMKVHAKNANLQET